MRLPYVPLKPTQGCLKEKTVSILVFSEGQRGEREGGRKGEEGREYERWRVKGSEARRGVRGRKRDHGIISTNRTIHELSVTVYVHSTGVIVQSATVRIPYPNRTPERPQPRCSYHSPGRGWRGNWHGHGPTPAFAPVQSAGVLWHVGHRGCTSRCGGCVRSLCVASPGVLVTVLTVVYCNTTCLSCHI